jgi:hypothetical protein
LALRAVSDTAGTHYYPKFFTEVGIGIIDTGVALQWQRMVGSCPATFFFTFFF